MSAVLYGRTRENWLREFRYDRASGELFRKYPSGRERRVGFVAHSGYVLLKVDYKRRRAHRIIWFMETGKIPPEVDHKNRARSDNRWRNLRAANRKLNSANLRNSKKKSGLAKGVFWRPDCTHRPYSARTHVDGKFKYLGSYSTEKEAAKAYKAALVAARGEFAFA